MKNKRYAIFVTAALAALFLLFSCDKGKYATFYEVSIFYEENKQESTTVISGEYFTFPSYTSSDGKTVARYTNGEESYAVGERIRIENDCSFRAVYDEALRYFTVLVQTDGKVVDYQVCLENSSYTLPKALDGEGFLGWQVNESYTIVSPGTKIVIKENTLIKPAWKYIVKYTVNVVSDGNVLGTEFVKDNKYTLPEALTKNGFIFKGWKIGESEDLLEPGEEITVTSDLEINAEWTRLYKISFALNGGESEKIPDRIVENNKSLEDIPNPPTRTGYTFLGWDYANKTSFDGSGYDFSSAVVSDVWLKAFWRINTYTIEFDVGGDLSSDVTRINATYNTCVEQPDNPTRTGYTFSGWFDGEQEFDFDTKITKDLTLKAKWTVNTYSVSFDSDGGTGYQTQRIDYDCKAENPGTPKKTGYTFSGWFYGDQEFDFDTKITQDIIIKAKWTVNTYIVSFDSDGGTEYQPQYIDYGCEAENPGTPEKTGFVFYGWYEGDEEYSFRSKISGNVSLKAVWAKEYKIGDKGPAGGTVFYDSGSYTTSYYWYGDGLYDCANYKWRYLETAPKELYTQYPYGYYCIDRSNPAKDDDLDVGTKTGVGEGLRNTYNLVRKMGDTAYIYSSGTKKGCYAAKACLDYSVTNNGITYDDWFLPSIDELCLMYTNLYLKKIGPVTCVTYLSSSEDPGGNGSAEAMDFLKGNQHDRMRADVTVYTIPARAF